MPALDIGTLLAVLAAIILVTKLLGDVAQRLGQPAVLGELVAGVILGVTGVLHPDEPVLRAFAELGVLVLLFEIGLSTDLRSLRQVGGTATSVAAVGVLVPFAAGYGVARLLGVSPLAALVAGAAMTATSIGISARVLRDVGRLDTPEGQVVLGAAVLDDIIGLIILSVVAGVTAGEGISALGIAKTTAIALGFVIVALAMGGIAIRPLFRFVERLRVTGALGLIALAFAFVLSWVAELSGSAMIIGAFAAGVILHPTPQRKEIERGVTSIAHFFVPIFFAVVGAAVDLRALVRPESIGLGLAILVVGVLGKVVAGYATPGFEGNRLLVGVAMIPRGEVGLIFAQLGLATAAISSGEFGAIMVMVVGTTLLTPPLLVRVARGRKVTGEHEVAGSVADLVAGTHRPTPRATQPVIRRKDNDE